MTQILRPTKKLMFFWDRPPQLLCSLWEAYMLEPSPLVSSRGSGFHFLRQSLSRSDLWSTLKKFPLPSVLVRLFPWVKMVVASPLLSLLGASWRVSLMESAHFSRQFLSLSLLPSALKNCLFPFLPPPLVGSFSIALCSSGSVGGFSSALLIISVDPNDLIPGFTVSMYEILFNVPQFH